MSNAIVGFFVVFALVLIVLTGNTKYATLTEEKTSPLPRNSLVRVIKSVNFKVGVGDKIILEHQYAVVPGAIPTKATINSSSDCIEAVETLTVGHAGGSPKVGGGTIGGFFKAVKPGTATISLTVESPSGSKTTTCKIEVE